MALASAKKRKADLSSRVTESSGYSHLFVVQKFTPGQWGDASSLSDTTLCVRSFITQTTYSHLASFDPLLIFVHKNKFSCFVTELCTDMSLYKLWA